MSTLGCTGHQEIPPAAAKHVIDELTAVVRAHAEDDLLGVCSLAKGADQLFARTVLSIGGELSVVVPSANYESTFDDEGLAAYRELLALAESVEHLSFEQPTEDAFLAAGRRVAEVCDVLVAVWDGAPAKGRGGTADIVSYARELGRRIEIVWPDGVVRN